MTEDRVQALLLDWESDFDCGRDIPPEELCREEPELAKELADRISALKQMKWLDHGESEYSATADSLAQRENAAVGETAVIAGRYRLENVVGEGAFGIVWRGFDSELQRPVALKIPKRDHQPGDKEVEAFREEARKLARLKRHGFVPVYDVVPHGGSYVIVSEYIEGSNLNEYLRSHRISVRQAVDYVASLARRFDYAHRHGILHRDIKPANIMINLRRELFITDFGIATTLDASGQPSDEDRRGTLPYMAPELLQPIPEMTDARSDVYALGVMFYQLLTGHLPFISRSSERLRAKILNDELVPPGRLREMPWSVEAICLKCLARDPKDRYASMASVAADLERFQPRRVGNSPQTKGKQALLLSWSLLGSIGLAVALQYFGASPLIETVSWLMAVILAGQFGLSIGTLGDESVI